MEMNVVVTASALLLCFTLASSQNNDDYNRREAVNKLFSTPSDDDFLPGYEEVTTQASGSLGALQKCGEGETAGKMICVKYHECDAVTKTVAHNRVLDIRPRTNQCPHYLDVCCNIRNEEREPGTNVPIPTRKTTTQRPYRNRETGCGIRNPNGLDFTITGNRDNEAEYGEFPWMVAILAQDNYVDSVSICGGSLIAPNVVLTGAHCISNYTADQIRIRAGEWDTQTISERYPYQERDVAKIIIHKDFYPPTVYNDVALLVLQSPVEDAENIGTICLPNQNARFDSNSCFVAGWGKDVFGKKGRYQVILKKIELPLVSRRECQESLRETRLGNNFNLHESFICAGGKEGKDACTGDGGSPLVCPNPLNPKRYLQVGIVSWGIGCGSQNVPGVYVDVAKFRSWIDNNLERLNIETNSYVN